MLSFSVLSSRPLGGDGTIRVCQRIKATKLLASRPLPLYDTSVSNHFHLDNQIQTFPLLLYSLTTPALSDPSLNPPRRQVTDWALHTPNNRASLFASIHCAEEAFSYIDRASCKHWTSSWLQMKIWSSSAYTDTVRRASVWHARFNLEMKGPLVSLSTSAARAHSVLLPFSIKVVDPDKTR